ncbi:MAG: hypothetical protein R3B98_00050 [Hyphomonas sp.]
MFRGDKAFINNQLGGFGANLGALAHFFDVPWGAVSPNLTLSARSIALNFAAFGLRAMGRLAEAEEAERAGLDMDVAQEDWRNAAVSASSVSQLRLALGNVSGAVDASAQAVDHADRSGDSFQMLSKRTAHANA